MIDLFAGRSVILGDQAADRHPGEIVEQRQHGLPDGAADQFEIDVDAVRARRGQIVGEGRSEEHTSELQSLMRISYAVFCLKKKKTTLQTITIMRAHNNT